MLIFHPCTIHNDIGPGKLSFFVFRKEQEFTQPLDLLNLTGIFDNRGACMRSFPSFKGKLCIHRAS